MLNKKMLLFFLIATICENAIAQSSDNIFESLTIELKKFKPDTTAPPNDKITKQIIKLREIKGGFNINEALQFKIGEEKTKGEKPKEEIEKLMAYFTNGHGAELLNNAVTWIYRNEFSFSELKKLTKFYKTSAGHKLSSRFPAIMLKCLAASEIIAETAIR